MKSRFEDPLSGEEKVEDVEEQELLSKQELEEVAEEVAASDKGLVNKVRKWINSKVAESKIPTKEGLGYESTMGVYGGKLVEDEEGKLVYDTRGFWSKIDQWGDRILRSFDEHHARKPGKMFLRRPLQFMKLLPFLVDSKRYRGTPEQTAENIKRLGLEDYYALHPWGIEVKDPKLFSNSIGLQDIFRQDQIDHEVLNGIDRFEALGEAADYMKRIHETAGGIAEGNVYNFMFTEHEGNTVSKPITMIPTEIYNPEKEISDIEQKTTDLLDLLASVAMEEYRRTEDWESVHHAFETVFERYNDPKVISMVAAYVKRGRLTLPNDLAAITFDTSPTYRIFRRAAAAHNTQRLTADPNITAQVREEIISACEGYAKSHIEEDSSET